jgi:predicted glycosyltransferase
MKKVIWIDLDNTPHVFFFRHIIDELKVRGFEIVLTARNCAQTCELADRFHLDYRQVGAHHGKNKFFKMAGLIGRGIKLVNAVKFQKPALALSHGSRAQVIASNILGIRSMIITDYEHAKGIPFLKVDVFMTPELISLDTSRREVVRVLNYPGIKEDVYMPFFNPDKNVIHDLGLSTEKIIVTMRPPASDAHYHSSNSDILFLSAMAHLLENEEVQIVVMPRNEKQKRWVKEKWRQEVNARRIIIPDKAIDGLSMMYFSDLVISGGGTMNREAAALGVPVYSIFRGAIGSVDKHLAEKGRLILLENENEIKDRINIEKWKRPQWSTEGHSNTMRVVVDNIVNFVNEN